MSNPLAQQDRSGLPATEASRDPFSIPTEVKASIRVLVVDDERTLRESCASVLQMDGYNVTTLGRGDEAIEMVRRRRFDVIHVQHRETGRSSRRDSIGRDRSSERVLAADYTL